MPLRTVLFDLDDTLFDHAQATRSALGRLRGMDPALGQWDLDTLFARHSAVLEELHRRVLTGELTVDEARLERFTRLLTEAGESRSEARAPALARTYRAAYEDDWRTVPGALELLEAVRRAGLGAVVVTNNGVAEQRKKLDRCGIGAWIDAMVTSEEVGVSKPSPEIFAVALRTAGVAAEEAVMVGDAWATDIAGAQGAGIRPVWLNRWRQRRLDPAVAELLALEPVSEAVAAVAPGLALPDARR